jgi:hypothetical protein
MNAEQMIEDGHTGYPPPGECAAGRHMGGGGGICRGCGVTEFAVAERVSVYDAAGDRVGTGVPDGRGGVIHASISPDAYPGQEPA